MEYNYPKKKTQLVRTFDATGRMDTSKTCSAKASLTEVRRKIGRPSLTWMKLVEKDLRSVNEYLELNDSTPEETITKLKDLTKDRDKWKNIIRDIMAVNR